MTNGKENEVSYFIIQLVDDVVHISVASVLPGHLLPQGDGVELVLDHMWVPLSLFINMTYNTDNFV